MPMMCCRDAAVVPTCGCIVCGAGTHSTRTQGARCRRKRGPCIRKIWWFLTPPPHTHTHTRARAVCDLPSDFRPPTGILKRKHTTYLAVEDLHIEPKEVRKVFQKIDRDHNNEIDVIEFRKFISQLCTDALLPRLMKTEIELGTRVLLAAACCIPTICLSWICMAKYERKKQNDSECIMLQSTVWIVLEYFTLVLTPGVCRTSNLVSPRRQRYHLKQ